MDKIVLSKDVYQKTEIGKIPRDWEVKKINEIAEVNKENLSGNTPAEYEFYYYDLSSVDKGKVLHPTEKLKFADAPSRAKRLFKRNDVLMSTVRPNLQGFTYVDFDSTNSVCSTGFAVIAGKYESDSMYIYQNLFSYGITRQIQKLLVGSNYPAINSKDVENLKVPFPNDKKEREKIASILSTWDKAIELKEKLIEQMKEKKKGLMQKLLTGRVRLPGFKGEWKKISLNKFIQEYKEKSTMPNQFPILTSSRNGLMLQSEYYSNRQVTTNDNVGYNIIPRGFITYRSRSDDGKFVFNKNTIIDHGIVSYFYPVFKFNDKVCEDFILELLNYTIERQASSFVEGTAQKVLSIKKLGSFKYLIPTIEEQKAIARRLILASKEVTLLESEVDALKQQKQGLMQQLLTGKVRVKV